ncbi:GNAT family N-acetyltransferase [Pontibacter mangrovi]|uniref:GNAT family N-acetyltransferase n=1 Tax=Pontibacter mangrovi TaxID=2589816 RepID=A0A501VYK5_9BACT|nr:GNAT family N-acetyltransferase [Pontibacter mangrovi]TPE39577.1 GNAT family N-acetyltransferase [Pontibacter mangrovi]
MMKTEAYSSLSAATRAVLEQYVEEEFGQVPFVQEREWARPDWVLLAYEGDAIATFCHVVLREVSIDGQTYKVAGINNVITPKAYRGKGYASQVLRQAAPFIFSQLGCAYGLLLCADALLPFYSRLGWYSLSNCTLYYHQPTGEQLYDSNTMLLLPPGQQPIRPQHIHLNGLPW